MTLKETFTIKFIPAVEQMLIKEKRHKARIESLTEINGLTKRAFIEESEKMIKYFEKRLEEYKKFAENLE